MIHLLRLKSHVPRAAVLAGHRSWSRQRSSFLFAGGGGGSRKSPTSSFFQFSRTLVCSFLFPPSVLSALAAPLLLLFSHLFHFSPSRESCGHRVQCTLPKSELFLTCLLQEFIKFVLSHDLSFVSYFLFFTTSVCLIRRYLHFCVPSRTNFLFVSLASVLWQLLACLIVRTALSMSTHLHLPTALRVFLPILLLATSIGCSFFLFVGHSWHAFSIHDSSSSSEHRCFSKRPLDWTTTFRAVATTIFSVCVSVSTSVKHLHFAHCLRKLSNSCEAICWKEQAQHHIRQDAH